MAKSKINIRFIAIFAAIVVLGIAFSGFVIWWQKVAGPERNFATAERYVQAGDPGCPPPGPGPGPQGWFPCSSD